VDGLVVWTPNSVTSRWVRGEAREAAERGVLVPVRFDQARLPMDVRAIHTTDLDGWGENAAGPQAQEFLRALGTHIARAQAARPAQSWGEATDCAESTRTTRLHSLIARTISPA
jgi:adenylate cyclase